MLPFPFNNRLFQGFVVLIVFITVILNQFVRLNHTEYLRDELMKLSAAAALYVDDDEIPSEIRTGFENSPRHVALQHKLKKVLSLNEHLVSVYLLRKGEQAGQYLFIADVSRLKETAQPGEAYDAAIAPEMANGFIRPSADKDIITDKWGATISGYAPIKTDDGRTVALIGLDYNAKDVSAALNYYSLMIALYMILILAVMLCFVVLVSNRFTRRLQRVTDELDNMMNGGKPHAIFDGDQDRLSDLATRVTKLAERISTERMEMILAAVTSLVSALEVKDHYTYGHSTAVAAITEFIALKMGVMEDERFDINFAAILHDIGKIGVLDHILNKHGKLTEEEWRQVKQHPVNGWKIISGIHSLDRVAEIIRYHHCRWDGHGYPEPLHGSDIPLGARIIAVADAYQAMVSDRPYRKGMTHYAAMKEISRGSASQFDPIVVRIFEEHQSEILRILETLDAEIELGVPDRRPVVHLPPESAEEPAGETVPGVVQENNAN